MSFSYTPRGTKLSRLAARIASRWSDYPELRQALSVEAAVQSNDGFRFQGFNANPLRGRIVQALAQALECTDFVETGCFRAATALSAHSFLKLPVWSCEKNLGSYLLSRLLTAGLSGMSIYHGESVDFLRERVTQFSANPTATPLFFLDAHGGSDGTGRTGDSCPLLEELETVLALPRLAVVVDDVALPGFIGGVYGEQSIDLQMLAPVLLKHGISSWRVPVYEASQDLGWPSGYCVFWRGIQADSAEFSRQFPLTLLGEQSLNIPERSARQADQQSAMLDAQGASRR